MLIFSIPFVLSVRTWRTTSEPRYFYINLNRRRTANQPNRRDGKLQGGRRYYLVGRKFAHTPISEGSWTDSSRPPDNARGFIFNFIKISLNTNGSPSLQLYNRTPGASDTKREIYRHWSFLQREYSSLKLLPLFPRWRGNPADDSLFRYIYARWRSRLI